MVKVVAQVIGVIGVMQMLTQALDSRDASQLEALSRKVDDWLMIEDERAIILALIASTEVAIEDLQMYHGDDE